MSTQKNNNDTKKAAGYFKEKFTIGLSRVTGDEVTRAIMKTTSHMLKAPNEKHLQRLLSATHGHFSENAQKEGMSMCRYIIEELEKRSHTHNWIVVLKTMLTFHAFLIDGSDEVNKVMQRNRNLFCGRSIKDLADSPDGAAQQRFITTYIRYLEERNITQMRIDLEVRIESSEYLTALKMMPMNILAQALTQLLQQLECIAVLEFREEIINNFATLEAHTRLINDGSHLYAFIADRMVYALEHFDELETKANKETWVVVYKRYAICIAHLRILFEKMRRSRVSWGSIRIPEIKEFPEALLTKLEEELNGSSKQPEAVPEIEDLNALLEEEERKEKQQEEEELPATMSSRLRDEGPPTSVTSPAAPPAADVNLFGDANSQFNSQQQDAAPIPPPPVKPKLPDLDDLFAGVPQGGQPAAAAGQWGAQPTAPQPQPQNNATFDVFAAQPQQPAWVPTANAAAQYGYASSSSGSAASPFANPPAPGTTAANPVDALFGAPASAPVAQQPVPSPGGQVPFHQQQSTANMFANPSSDFLPINNDSARFDPFGQPPRENVFANNPPANANMFGAPAPSQQQQPPQQQRPRNDMDDLFS